MRAALLLPLLLAGCDLSMKRQPKDDPQESATLWPGGPPIAPPPEGSVATDAAARAAAYAKPPRLTAALMDRGEARYAIFCAPCHGLGGTGDGVIVKRGFPAPPSFHTPRLVAAPPQHIVQVITHGYGIMYSYADRVEPADRWAIAAWVKTLQRAGPAR